MKLDPVRTKQLETKLNLMRTKQPKDEAELNRAIDEATNIGSSNMAELN